MGQAPGGGNKKITTIEIRHYHKMTHVRVFLQYLHDIFFHGSLKQGEDWGGEECAAYVPMHVHLKESITWILMLILLSIPLNVKDTVQDVG